MKKSIQTAILLLLSLCFLSQTESVFAQKSEQEFKLKVWSNIRFRYEFQNHFNLKSYGTPTVIGEDSDGFCLGRVRAGLLYFPTPQVGFSLGIQHADEIDLAFEDEDFYNAKFKREHNPYKDSLEPFETYVIIKNILNESLSFKAGRQLIFYGDKRVFGPGAWGNSGRWIWDAATFNYRFKGGAVDVYYGKTIVHDPDRLSLSHGYGFESMGMYGSFSANLPWLRLGVEPFIMTKSKHADRFQGEDGQPGELESYYVGMRLYGKDFMGMDLDLTYIIQDGDYGNDDIDAYAYHLLLAYQFPGTLFNLRPSIEYSFASGDSDPTDGTYETFDGAFGARDKMYGRMNLFHWMNLRDAQVNLEMPLLKALSLKVEYHRFQLAEEKDGWYLNAKKYRDKTGSSGRDVGKELDVTGKLDLPKGHELQFGYGHFWPDEFAKKLASDDEADWVFLQWVWKFSHRII